MAGDEEVRRGRLLPAGQGSPAIGTPGSLTTLGGSSSGTTAAQTGNTDTLRVTQELAEVVSKAANPFLRVTQELAEVPSVAVAKPLRITQVVVECVVERDYAGWDTIVVDDVTQDPTVDVVSF